MTAALRAGAAALLVARGEREEGAIVAGGDVEIIGAGEAWSIGSRQVTAHRVALIVDAPAHAALSSDPGKRAAIRAAFEAAMMTPETALLDLAIVLRLPSVKVGWHRAYRDVVPSYEDDRPEPGAVLGGAAALLEAIAAASPKGARDPGEPNLAAILRRATLDAAVVPGASSPSLVRYVIRLQPDDFALIDRSPDLTERLQRAVHEAGTRASESVASVELAVAVRAPRPLGRR